MAGSSQKDEMGYHSNQEHIPHIDPLKQIKKNQKNKNFTKFIIHLNTKSEWIEHFCFDYVF